jgi:hypothetical protein
MGFPFHNFLSYMIFLRLFICPNHSALLYCILTLHTHSIQQNSSWEVNRLSASQGIPHILRKPKLHYCIHNCQPPVPTLSQINPVHALTSHLLKFYLNIILPSTPGSSKWTLSTRFPHQNPVYTSAFHQTCYILRPSHPSLFYHQINIW